MKLVRALHVVCLLISLRIFFGTLILYVTSTVVWGQSRCRDTTRFAYEFDSHSRQLNIYLYLYFNFFALVSSQRAVLSSTTQQAMPPEFSWKWGTEWLNIGFLLPTLLCAGYSVKVFFLNNSTNSRIKNKLRDTVKRSQPA